MQLNKMLSTMKAPKIKRNLNKKENVRWLVDNLEKENKKHPYYEIVIEKLKERMTALQGE